MTATYVEGVALEIGWADARRNLMELIFTTVRRAVDDSGRDMGDIDSVVLSAHDLVDGRSLSSMVTAPAAGAYLRDEIRLGDDGAAAFSLAAARLEAGEATCSIVAAWGRASEGAGDPDAVARALFDPIIDQPFGLTELAVSGFRAQQWIGRYGRHDEDHDGATRRRAHQARANPRALQAGGRTPSGAPFPIGSVDLPRFADVVAAVVISNRPAPIRVAGIGQASEAYSPGDRDLAALPGLTLAVQRAMPAGVTAPDIDVAEVDGPTAFDEALACEAAGLAAPGQGFAALGADQRLNPSGGSAAGYCAPAMGLTRIAEAVLQLRGNAGAVQVGAPRLALATGSSTVAAQTHTAVVLERA